MSATKKSKCAGCLRVGVINCLACIEAEAAEKPAPVTGEKEKEG